MISILPHSAACAGVDPLWYVLAAIAVVVVVFNDRWGD